MSLPPVLQVGPHRLKLLTVSCDAEGAGCTRRSSDSLLNAFCFVGELKTSAAETTTSTTSGSSAISSTATEGASRVAITWYYSPLFQYERKRIRVEESVIDVALTRALMGNRHAEVNPAPLDLADVDTVESVASDTVHSMADVAAEAGAGPSTSAATLPAVYVRLGMSTTFREYRLAATEPSSPPPDLGSVMCVSGVAAVAVDATTAVPEHTPPVLRPLAPRRPSLNPINTSGSVNPLRSSFRLAHKRAADLHRSATRASPEEAADEVAAVAAEENRRTPLVPSSLDCSTACFSPLRPDSARREPYDAAFPMPVSLPNGYSPCLRRASLAAQLSPPMLSGNHWEAHEPGEPKTTTTSDAPPAAIAAPSSESSAFLSSSLFFSCGGSQAAASGLSTNRSAATDTDGHLPTSESGSGTSGRFFEDSQLQSHDLPQTSSAAGTPLSHSTSCPTPPRALTRPTVRRRPFHTLGGDSGRPNSSRAMRMAHAEPQQQAICQPRAATPPSAR